MTPGGSDATPEALISVPQRADAPGEGRTARSRLDAISPAKRALLAKRLAGGGRRPGAASPPAAGAESPALSADQRRGPLSFPEERFWIAYTFEDQSSAYHVPVTLHLRGALSVPALTEALRTLTARHSILRTRYPIGPEGEPIAVVHDPEPVDLPCRDVEGNVGELLDRAAAAPFDLEADAPIRSVLLKVSDDEHYLHVTLHHIVTDAWSTNILLQELTTAYTMHIRGERPGLPELTVQYRDHARWQRAQAEPFARQLAYWQKTLDGAPRDLGLPTDRPRPAEHRPLVPGRCLTTAIPADPALRLTQRTGATLFMVLLAAYSAVLGRRAGRQDVVVGTPVAGRPDPEVDPLIGCFINTLAMRTDLSGDPTAAELLSRVRERTLHAYENQDVPFQQVIERVGERTDGRKALFQAWLALQNVPDAPLEMAGLEVEEAADTIEATKFDLTFHVLPTGDRLELRVEYDTSLFDEESVRGLIEEFSAFLSAAAAAPDRRLSEIATHTTELEVSSGDNRQAGLPLPAPQFLPAVV
ncbi:condensation domain-containing protein [Streptomyces sp. MMS24-I31]|uniref:condensation domain-containing protein n=1 Tax=Streptomyces sp. MMS24-I31 TaxID=3351563 RepID=UPI003896C6DF